MASLARPIRSILSRKGWYTVSTELRSSSSPAARRLRLTQHYLDIWTVSPGAGCGVRSGLGPEAGLSSASAYLWSVTVEGTRAATSSPSGRMVLRAEEAASSGPPWPNILKQESYSRVDHDQVWRNGRQKQSYRQKGCECVQEVIEAVLPSEMVIKAMN